MNGSVPYLVVAYLGTAALYGAYLAHLWRTERRLARRNRGPAR
jgi:hypothetical protein